MCVTIMELLYIGVRQTTTSSTYLKMNETSVNIKIFEKNYGYVGISMYLFMLILHHNFLPKSLAAVTCTSIFTFTQQSCATVLWVCNYGCDCDVGDEHE